MSNNKSKGYETVKFGTKHSDVFMTPAQDHIRLFESHLKVIYLEYKAETQGKRASARVKFMRHILLNMLFFLIQTLMAGLRDNLTDAQKAEVKKDLKLTVGDITEHLKEKCDRAIDTEFDKLLEGFNEERIRGSL